MMRIGTKEQGGGIRGGKDVENDDVRVGRMVERSWLTK